MANIKSQIKRNKQNELRRQRNQAVKSRLKTAVRKFRELSEAGDKDAAVAASRDAMRPMSGRLPRSRSPPQPNTQTSLRLRALRAALRRVRLSAFATGADMRSRSARRTFSSASGVWA